MISKPILRKGAAGSSAPQGNAVRGRLQSIAQSPASQRPNLCFWRHRFDFRLQRGAFVVDRGDDRPDRHPDIDQHGFGELKAGLDRLRYRIRGADAIEMRRMAGIALPAVAINNRLY